MDRFAELDPYPCPNPDLVDPETHCREQLLTLGLGVPSEPVVVKAPVAGS